MPRYWVIAPFGSKDQSLFEDVWNFDLANGTISIGWPELGDVSGLELADISARVAEKHPQLPPATKSLITNMMWSFFRKIAPGDVIVARRGRKVLAAVGTVTRSGYFAPGKNPLLASAPNEHPNFLDVSWQHTPNEVTYDEIVFPMHTLSDLTEEQYTKLLGSDLLPLPTVVEKGVENPTEFVLEKYLEDVIVTNFKSVFKGELVLYEDETGGNGQQFGTEVGPIDILAVDASSKDFVVIELKKGKSSDQVVGQVMRYMGWVKQKLCQPGQSVRGLVVCRNPDPKLTYALSVANNIQVRYYQMDFKLVEKV